MGHAGVVTHGRIQAMPPIGLVSANVKIGQVSDETGWYHTAQHWADGDIL